MFNLPHQFSGALPLGLFATNEVPFGLATLQNDDNCKYIEAPWEVWGVQDFPPSSYSSDDKLAWGATKNVDWVQRNALIYSDDLTNAAWTKSSTSAPSAGVLQCSAATATHEFRSTTGPITPVVGQTYYLSCKAKQGTSPYVQLACFSGMHGTAYANFDLSTGAAGTSTACTPTITGPDGDGYYTVTIAVVATGTPSASGFRLSIQQSASDTRQQSWAAAGTETVNIKNIGLYVGSLPSYQAIGADWDTTYTANAIAAGYPIALWQDSAGTKAVNADNQAIGACRDLKYWDYGPELVTNGDGSSGTTGWTASTNTSVSNPSGKIVVTATGSYPKATQALSLVSGKKYLITAEIGYVDAPAWIMVSSADTMTPNRQFSVVLNSSSTTTCFVFTSTISGGYLGLCVETTGIGKSATFDNISVREIPGYTAIQATTSNQPKWRLDANGKPYIERDLINDSLPITLPNLGSNCVIYTAEGNVTLKDSGITLNGSYAPLTPAADYGRIIMAADSQYDAKIIKYLDGKRGISYSLGPELWVDANVSVSGESQKLGVQQYRLYSTGALSYFQTAPLVFTVGRTYLFTYTISSISTSGNYSITDTAIRTAALGIHQDVVTYSAGNYIKRSTAIDCVFTNVSVREVLL